MKEWGKSPLCSDDFVILSSEHFWSYKLSILLSISKMILYYSLKTHYLEFLKGFQYCKGHDKLGELPFLSKIS